VQRSLPVFVSEHLLQVDDRRREFTDNQTHSGTGPGHGHSFLIQLSSLLFSSLLFSSLSLSLSLSSINTKEDAPNKRRFSASAMVSGELWLSFVLVFAACAMVLASHLATSLQVAHRLLLLLTLNFEWQAVRAASSLGQTQELARLLFPKLLILFVLVCARQRAAARLVVAQTTSLAAASGLILRPELKRVTFEDLDTRNAHQQHVARWCHCRISVG